MTDDVRAIAERLADYFRTGPEGLSAIERALRDYGESVRRDTIEDAIVVVRRRRSVISALSHVAVDPRREASEQTCADIETELRALAEDAGDKEKP